MKNEWVILRRNEQKTLIKMNLRTRKSVSKDMKIVWKIFRRLLQYMNTRQVEKGRQLGKLVKKI